MAIQQLTQPILNPIAAFDGMISKTISFIVIGGAQVIGNRLIISDNQTGRQIYNNTQSTMKLEHTIPAGTLSNGRYYNAVIYTIDSSGTQSMASVAVPFYCYSQPTLTIDNIPSSETIENGTYQFTGSYLQSEGEALNSYQFTLYDSNKNILSQTPLIYYETDDSLSYTFVGMSNDTSYYVSLTGETVNNTKITSGLKYFTVRYLQPASFAICDLVNDCDNGFIQISSNIVAIDGKSNPEPPIYIDDKEVDLRDPDSWVRWGEGFSIKNDFTMRVWGRDFNPYENIITLSNNLNSTGNPNKIEMKWMIGETIKNLPQYKNAEGKNVNLKDSKTGELKNLMVGGSTVQETREEIYYGKDTSITIVDEEKVSADGKTKRIPHEEVIITNIYGNQHQLTQEESSQEIEGENIHLEDVDSSKPADLFIKGNDYQETREGYNLLDFNVAQDKKVTVNDDGTITINGSGGFDIKFKKVVYKKGVTYKTKATLVSGTYTGSDPRHIGIMTPYGDNEWLANNIFRTYTFLEDKVSSGMWTDAACVFNNATFEIYSYEGTEDKPFEQYGLSPSPDYPSEIETVSDSVKIDVLNNDNTKSQSVIMPIQQEMLTGDYIKDVEHHEWGKTIFSGDEDIGIEDSYEGITQFHAPISDNGLWINDEVVRAASNYFKGVAWANSWTKDNSVTVKYSKSVRFMTSQYTTVDSFKSFLKSKYNEGNPVIVYYKLETPVSLALTSSQQTAQSQLTNMTLYQNITNISNEGSYPAIMNLNYNIVREMPSPDYPSEIETVGSNVNLFDKDKANIMHAGFENNVLTTGDARRTLYLKIQPNTSYVVSKIVSTRFDVATTQNVPSIGLTVSNKISNPTGTNITIKSGSNDNYIIVYYYNTGTDTLTEQEVLDSIKIEKGSLATPYSPYNQGSVEIKISNNDNTQSQSVIMPIQQEMLTGDYVADVEHHEWKKLIFDENSDIECTHNNKTFQFRFLKYLEGTGATTKVICNMAKYWNMGALEENGCFISWDGYFEILCKENEFGFNVDMTTDEAITHFKTKLANSKLIVYYKLATPINLELTEEQRAPKNMLYNWKTYIPITHINTDSDFPILESFTPKIPSLFNESVLYSLGQHKNLINIPNFVINYSQGYGTATKTDLVLRKNSTYTLSFEYNITNETTDAYYSIGYGVDAYEHDLNANIIYTNSTTGKNVFTLTTPENLPENNFLWIKFGHTIILADLTVEIMNIQLEYGEKETDYQSPNLYNIYPAISNKNLYDFRNYVYTIKNNAVVQVTNNGYNIQVKTIGEESSLAVGFMNILNPGETYAISFQTLGGFSGYKLYTTEKNSQIPLSEIIINDGIFIAPEGVYDLQLVFLINSDGTNNSTDIWNIQIEQNNQVTEYETHESNKSQVVIGEPLRGIEEYRDLIFSTSPNILNPQTKSAAVEGNKDYYLNQRGNTLYYVWYYNKEGNLITFIDEEGKEASGAILTRGIFTTHEDCVRIIINKSANPQTDDLSGEEILNNNVMISEYSSFSAYYPYLQEPSEIRYIKKIELTGDEDLILATGQRFRISLQDNNYPAALDTDDEINAVSNYLTGVNSSVDNVDYSVSANGNSLYLKFTDNSSGNDVRTEIKSRYDKGEPIQIFYKMKNSVINSLSSDNNESLQKLVTYEPISNVFTDNSVLGMLNFSYINSMTEQQTENAYVQLKCYNMNKLPYYVHSNYIDIPDDTDKVFIWVRRKNNLFDLKIENLGDYSGDKPGDKNKPIVSLDIDLTKVTSTQIPVIANAVDETGLKTIRFSKDNGETWEEVIAIDGLSTTKSYVFENLIPETTYTIRVEAIDVSGNIGGISQNVTTKAT